MTTPERTTPDGNLPHSAKDVVDRDTLKAVVAEAGEFILVRLKAILN